MPPTDPLIRPAPGSGVAVAVAGDPGVVGLARWSVRAHADGSAPGGSSRRPAGPARPRRARRPRGRPRRRPAGRCRRRAPAPRPRRGRRRRWPRCARGTSPARSSWWRTAKADASWAARTTAGGTHADVEVVQRRPAGRVVERHPLAPQVRLPDRAPGRVGRRPAPPAAGRRPSRPAHPVHEQPTGVRRTTDQRPARAGVRHGPEPGDLPPVGDDGPHDEGRAEDDQHVAVRRSAPATSCSPKASMVPPPSTRAAGRGDGRRPGSLPATITGSRVDVVEPAAAAATSASQPWKSNSGSGGVAPPSCRWRRRRRGRGWRRPGPASSRRRRGARATSHSRKPTQLPGSTRSPASTGHRRAAVVAVEQPGRDRPSVGVDGAQRRAPWRRRRRRGCRADPSPASAAVAPRASSTPGAPGGVGVVGQLAGARRVQLVGDPAAGHDPAVARRRRAPSPTSCRCRCRP